jgi:AhpD family alkylhydroperoxidase
VHGGLAHRVGRSGDSTFAGRDLAASLALRCIAVTSKEKSAMALVPLLDDNAASPRARAVFDDIRATRGTAYINNIWRALANDPAQLEATWSEVKRVMAPGALDPLTKELVYIAVSAANNCGYCLHSHTAAARAKGMSEAMFNELMQVVVLASQTNRIAIGLQVAIDDRYAAPPEQAAG